jgi:predicted transcriptional regulator
MYINKEVEILKSGKGGHLTEVLVRDSSVTVMSRITANTRRSREEMVEEILNEIGRDPSKTHCRDRSNTPYTKLTKDLNWLQKEGLVESESGYKKGLFLTEKGKMVLHLLRPVNKALCKDTDISVEERARQLSELDLKRVGFSVNQTQSSEYKYRSENEIIYGILNATRNNEPSTRIRQRLRMSYVFYKQKLNMLEEYGFVEKGELTKPGEKLRAALGHLNSILYPQNPAGFVKLQRT